MESNIRKVFGHLRTVLKHKYWVFHYARLLGIPWRGIKHDLSKFSPVEFWESVQYWDGKSSPIPKCKADKGYSLAWQHHKGHNSHHYEYWVDKLDEGGVAIKMPWEDLLELVADYCGAGRAYQGKSFTMENEYYWFRKKMENEKPKIHPTTAMFIEHLLFLFVNPEYLRNFKGNLSEFWKRKYEES